MIPSRRNLLETLRNKQPVNSEEMLTNVRSSLGSLGQAVGNPLTKNEISISVDVIFFDTTAVPAAIIVPAALPAGAQTELPFYLFGLTDMYSGYNKARFLEPLNPAWGVVGPVASGFWQYNLFAVLPFIGAIPNNLYNFFAPGDYIIHYRFFGGVNFQAVIVIHCDNIAYASLLFSLMSDIIYIDTIRYFVNAAAILQFTRSLNIATLSTFGKLNVDSIDPRLYVLPTSPQQTIADLPLKIPFDKRCMIGSQIDFTCQHIDFIFFVKNIEVLTKRDY